MEIPVFADPMVRNFRIVLPYEYYAGRAATRFLTELRDKAKIIGLRCSACERVYVPPRETCPRCFALLQDWVEVANQGKLVSYTVVHQSNSAQPSAPFSYGIVRLDGADSSLTHFLGEVAESDLRVGLRVEAVFQEEREAKITAIRYFRPVSSAG